MSAEANCSDPLWEKISQGGFLGRRRVYLFDTVDSTNSIAQEYGRSGAKSGTVVIARTQSKGRGRLGKEWLSPAGSGLYFSVILRPRLEIKDLAKITLAAGLAVARAVEEAAGIETLIKWPNDVLVNDKKLAGILTESGGNGEWVVLGVGINLYTGINEFPLELRQKATSLKAATGRCYGKGTVLEAILGEVDLQVQRLEAGFFEDILAEWRAKEAGIGQWLRWQTPAGKVVNGLSLGPNQDGLLMIRDQEGKVHQVLSGDITIRVKSLNGYPP